MKKLLLSLMVLSCISAYAQTNAKPEYVYTEASDLTLIGKIHKDTPNPYHRVDTAKFKGFTRSENGQVRMSSGIAVVFKTNSPSITVKSVFRTPGYPTNTNGYSGRGYDLKSVQIGVEKGSVLEAMDNPFRHRIGVFGSSFTHGSSTSRSGMTYVAQLSRNTGLHMLSLGCSGNSKLQSYFADVLCAAEVDALLFDAFSNPNVAMMKERFFPFVEKLVKAHPGKPLIFQRTIYRESRNFNKATDASERAKIETADSLMNLAMKKYPDIHYIYPVAHSKDHNATVDGTHPDNYGYTLWAKSIEKPLLKILKKYNIK